jgi:hypothetical protein
VADRNWLLASEVDRDSTLIGGSAELIERSWKRPGWGPGRST